MQQSGQQRRRPYVKGVGCTLWGPGHASSTLHNADEMQSSEAA